MRILVIGSGGREHALVWKIRQSPLCTDLIVTPGNGGTQLDGVRSADVKPDDILGLLKLAREEKVDLVVPGPELPLVLGITDAMNVAGIPCFGPDRYCAQLEGSKYFAKALMKKAGVPTAECAVFNDAESAHAFVAHRGAPLVIKADGLAAGKGVVVARTTEEALQAVDAIMKDHVFGDAGRQVVIEECLEGEEVSLLCLCDGLSAVPLPSAQDHKAAYDGDKGPNTGGMGAVAPNPYYTKEIAAECMENIFLPTIRAMRAEGRPFRGCLYFGLMLTKSGPKVVEYNCRFGDPETQAVLPLLKSDLLTVMQATTNGTLADVSVEFSTDSACCVVLAAEGYPQKYESGVPITMSEEAAAHCYVAGAKKDSDTLLTAGGRVLGVTAVAPTLRAAVEDAYHLAEGVDFANKYCRGDIGSAALAAREGRG